MEYMDQISALLQERLQATSKLLLTHALRHALSEAPDESDALQTVINMQAAIELYSKLFLLRRHGWQSILDARLHSWPEPRLIAAIETHTIKTIQFWRSKELISESIYLDHDDVTLLNEFQALRNQLLHLGMVAPPREIVDSAIWLLVRVVHQLEWNEALPHHKKYFANSAEAHFGRELFERLLTRSSYVDEAVDRAHDQYSSSVRHCFECAKPAMVENEFDDLSCLVCGFLAPVDSIGFTDCPACGTKDNLAYDRLNVEREGQLGMCCRCRTRFEVLRCKDCNNDFVGRCAICSEA